MSNTVQYVMNSEGERVGVLLDLETYQQLTEQAKDAELLTDLSGEELQALANCRLAPEDQSALSELLSKNSEGQLSEGEQITLEKLLAQVEQLNILKTRARYTLHKLRS